MKFGFVLGLLLLLLTPAMAVSPGQEAGSVPAVPRYTNEGRLLFPENYREWTYLSSGLGMTYSRGGGDPQFTNVFVSPAAYREFVASGKWPDKTIFVVEERSAATKGSINKGGQYQSEFLGLGVEVKDAGRFPEKWAYFSFGPNTKTSRANPQSACFQCHEEHAAVEHSFVQFYPTLQPIARKFGVYRESRTGAAP
jgi:hypothetical protein